MNCEGSGTSPLTVSTGMFRLKKPEFVQLKHLGQNSFAVVSSKRTAD